VFVRQVHVYRAQVARCGLGHEVAEDGVVYARKQLQLLPPQQLSRLRVVVRGDRWLLEGAVALSCRHEAQRGVRRIALAAQRRPELQQLLGRAAMVYLSEEALLERLLDAVELGLEARRHRIRAGLPGAAGASSL
jgi:hypothetical protein